MACEPLRMPLPFDPGFHKSERSGTPIFTVCTMPFNDLDLTESPYWNIALKTRYIIHPSDSNPSPSSEMDPQWCKLFVKFRIGSVMAFHPGKDPVSSHQIEIQT